MEALCFSLAWISSQPWSNGAVGMYGKSWGGFNGLQVAYEKPQELKGIITLYSTGIPFPFQLLMFPTSMN